MKLNKILSLIFGLTIILVASAVSTQMRYDLKNGPEITAPAPIMAEVQTLVYSPGDVQDVAFNANPVRTADYCFVNAGLQSDSGEQPDITPDPDTDTGDGLFTWQNILSVVLSGVSIFVGVYWRKASNTLHEIAAALDDKRVTTEEIRKIVNAWKG